MSDFNYKTIKEPSEGLFKDKGSKFIAYAYPILSEDEVKPLLLHLKKEHPTARHHCYAWRLGLDNNNYRVNDDGEPSGSAGRPILNALMSKGVSNIIVFVVRYFGGTLLGVPGLINAYKLSTIDAIDNAVVIEKTLADIYSVRFEYLQMNDVMKVIKDNSLKILQQEFDNQCTIKLLIEKADTDRVISKLSDIEQVECEYIETE